MYRKLYHPNIVSFIGIGFRHDTAFIVTELMTGGTLRNYINPTRGSRATLHTSISLQQKIALLKDVCRGMIYLHGMNPLVCHRDLKTANILVRIFDWTNIAS